MSITTQALRVALRVALAAAALCAAASPAEAKPRRVVILDFDGPRQLADNGRSSVLSALGEHYDVVATKRWEQARAAAAQQTHGPAQWSRAAKQAGVDAVIEGWVQDEGRRKILNIVVREASNGREFDTISVRLDGKNGISTESSRKLQSSLEEVLDWIDGASTEPAPVLPPINTKKIGPVHSLEDDGEPVRRRRRPVIDDEATDEPTRRRARRDDRDERVERDDRGDGGDRGERAERAERADRDDTGAGAGEGGGEADRTVARTDDAPAASDAEPVREAKPVEVSSREDRELENLFPQTAEDRVRIFGKKVNHVPQKTKRFLIDAGGYMGSRSLIWDADPEAAVMQFAGVSSKGLALNAAIYPFPLKPIDGVPSGVGFTGSIHHSLGSTVIFPDEETVEEYVINQNGFELGARYRAPLNDLIVIEGGAYYGNQTYEIVDASPFFEVPDTKYSYLGASAHLDLAITDRALIGFGARYFSVLDAGDLAGVEWFGPADASGLGVEASFVIPLPASLYVRGQLSYQRISLELSGGGVITDEEGVLGGRDSLIVGNAHVGVAF
jgi:hypothetical protein